MVVVVVVVDFVVYAVVVVAVVVVAFVALLAGIVVDFDALMFDVVVGLRSVVERLVLELARVLLNGNHASLLRLSATVLDSDWLQLEVAAVTLAADAAVTLAVHSRVDLVSVVRVPRACRGKLVGAHDRNSGVVGDRDIWEGEEASGIEEVLGESLRGRVRICRRFLRKRSRPCPYLRSLLSPDSHGNQAQSGIENRKETVYMYNVYNSKEPDNLQVHQFIWIR